MMNFCNLCAGALRTEVPAGDNMERRVCSQCGHVHYINPKVIVGTIPIWQDRVLLCRRNIEPRLGLWTIPAGFLEMGESMAEGALRETIEESRAAVKIRQLHGTYDITRIGQIYVIYLADMLSDHCEPTPESSEVKLFERDQIPWDQLAFKVVNHALRQFFETQRPANGDPFNWEPD